MRNSILQLAKPFLQPLLAILEVAGISGKVHVLFEQSAEVLLLCLQRCIVSALNPAFRIST